MQGLPMPFEVPQHLLRRAGDEISTLRTVAQIGPDAWEIECDSSAFDMKRPCLGRPLLFHSSAGVRLIVDREPHALDPTGDDDDGSGRPIYCLRYRCMSNACAHKAPLRLGTMRLRRGRWLPTLERFFFSPPPSPPSAFQRSLSRHSSPQVAPSEWRDEDGLSSGEDTATEDGGTPAGGPDKNSPFATVPDEENRFDPRFSPLTALVSVSIRRQRQLDPTCV